jgi:hypothetical protein
MTIDVSLELAPADESTPQARLLLEACNIAMHPARCVVGQDAKATTEDSAIAILRWGHDHTDARIEVGLRLHGVAAWRKRNVFFSRADPESERWCTVGYAIALLVGEVASAGTNEPNAGANPPSTASQSSNRGGQDLREGAKARFWLDTQFALADEIPGFAPASGGQIRFSSFVFGRRGSVSGAVQGTFQQWPVDSLSVLQATASLGGGLAVLRIPHVDVAVRAEALLRLIDSTGTDPASGVAGNGHVWGVGFAEQVDAAWMWSNRIGFVAGVGFSEMTADTELTAHGQALVHIPVVHLESAAGLRLAFP